MTTTPDTDRQARREQLAAIVRRTLDGKQLTEPEAFALAGLVNIEQDDGDQAREQLAAAERDHNTRRVDLTQALGERMDLPWPTLLGAVRTTVQARANLRDNLRLIRDTHETHRKALAEALGLIDAREWPDMIDQVQVIRAAATERADLLEEARDALEAAGQNGPHGDDWPAIMPGIRALADAAREARRGEAEAVRAREAAEAGERRAMEQRQQMAEERFAWQERGDRAEISARAHKTAAAEALERAERAEATLTAVRKAVAGRRAEVADYEAERPPSAWSDAVAVTCDRVEEAIAVAALGDPQPATQPEPCAHGCRQAADDLTRLGQEIDTTPDGADRIVAYQARSGRLYCTHCGDGHGHCTPRTAGDLPDGGICFGCGTDVLIKPEVLAACGPQPTTSFTDAVETASEEEVSGPDPWEPDEPEQPAEPLLRGTAPLVLSLDIAPAEIAALLSKVRRAARAMRKAGLL